MPKTNTDTTTKPEKERRLRLADMIRADRDLPAPARQIGAHLATLCGVNQPYAYPSQIDLQERFASSPRAVGRAVKALEDRGYFKRKRSGNRRGEGWGNNQYHPQWIVLEDSTSLKRLKEPCAGGTERWPMAQPKMADGHQPEMADQSADNGRYNQPKMADITQEQHQGGTKPETPYKKCSASRTVPLAGADLAGDAGWRQFLACHPWRQDRHNGMVDAFWWRTFDQARSKHGLEEVIARVGKRADLLRQKGFGNLSSAGHFLHNEFGHAL